MSDLARIFLIVLILFGNAFFVAAEYALVTARRSHLEELESQGDPRAKVALGLTRTPLRFVSTIQLGVTFFSILVGAVGEPLLEQLFTPAMATTLAFLLAFALLTLMHVTLGELVPKAIALSRREEMALQLALPLHLFELALRPFIWLLEAVTTLLTRPFGISPPPAGVGVETERDIRLMVAQAEEAGVIEEAEEEMLYKVFDFADKEVREVMVPRPDVDAIPVGCKPGACLARMTETQHTRYPVYGRSLDDVVGILNVHDFMAAVEDVGLAAVRIEELVRPVYAVPETKDLGALLAELRRTGQQMVLVVDEYGSVQGIATLEDLVEQIVGEIADEYDLPDESLAPTGEGRYLVHGTFPLDDFNEQLGQRLPLEDYHTLAGFVFGELGHAPTEGDEVVWNGVRFRVLKTDGARIKRLEAALPRAREADTEEIRDDDDCPPAARPPEKRPVLRRSVGLSQALASSAALSDHHRERRPMMDTTSFLDEAGVDYELLEHPHTERAVDEAAALGVAPEEVAKTLILRTPEGNVRAVLAASERIDLHKVGDVLGVSAKKVRLATEDDLARDYREFALGAVPPFGGTADRVIVDRLLAGGDSVVLEAGSHERSVRMKAAVLVRLTGAQVFDITRGER